RRRLHSRLERLQIDALPLMRLSMHPMPWIVIAPDENLLPRPLPHPRQPSMLVTPPASQIPAHVHTVVRLDDSIPAARQLRIVFLSRIEPTQPEHLFVPANVIVRREKGPGHDASKSNSPHKQPAPPVKPQTGDRHSPHA